MPDHVRTVAIFNASDDTVEMLKEILSHRGYRALSAEVDHVKSGTLDFMAFMATHRPDAIIWDIAPPYERNWNFFKLCETPGVAALPYRADDHKQEAPGQPRRQETGAIEVIGKPYDLEAIADGVARGLEREARPNYGNSKHGNKGRLHRCGGALFLAAFLPATNRA